MYNEDDDDDIDSLLEEQISRSLHKDQINTEEISRLVGEIIEDLLENIFPNCDDSEHPQEKLGFSDNFIDVFKFSDSRDNEEDQDTEGAIIKSPELLERNFTNIFQSC